MDRALVVIFFLVGYACAYEWHFGNDNPNYVYIEYMEGNIWPLGKSTKIVISVPPCMMVKYVWVGVINLISNPSVTYNRDTHTVMIQYGLLSSSLSGYHVVAKGMRDPACGGGGTGGGDPHCPPPTCPPQYCSVPNCPPPNCILPNEPPRCPPSNCPPLYCPPPNCPPPNCPRPNCPHQNCPIPQCPPPQCYQPYVPAQCPAPYCPGCPQPHCNGHQHQQRYALSGKKKNVGNSKLIGKKKNSYGRQRDRTVTLDYIDGIEIYNSTGMVPDKSRYEVIDGNGNIMDQEAFDFEDVDDSEIVTDSDESDNVQLSEVTSGKGGEKHDFMLLIVSDKKSGKQVAGERKDGYGRGKGHAKGSSAKINEYIKNSRYNKGYYGDGLYAGNSGEATGNGKVKGIGYIKDVRYDWGNENAKESVYSSRDRDERTTDSNGGSRGNSGHDNSEDDRDWGYGYDANIFYPGEGSRGSGSDGNDRGSNNGRGSALCSSYYNAKSGYGGNRGNGKGSTFTGSDLCDENAIERGFVALERDPEYRRVDDQVLDGGYGY